MVGVAATLVHIGVAWIVLPFANVFVANLCGFVVAFFVSYAGHSLITFRRRGHFGKFLATALGGLAINFATLSLLVVWGAGDNRIALAVAALVSPAFVFVISKLWAFK